MNLKRITFGLLTIGLMGCNSTKKEERTKDTTTYPDLNIVGAMKNVMWKGELGSNIDLDTISDHNGLYGLGPVSYLTGELLINDGQGYVSKVTSDSTMIVEKRLDVSAPFFVYGHVMEWNEIELPANIRTIQELESFVHSETTDFKRPFAFKLIGKVESVIIHVQNLPEGTKVSSPKEAHQGQVDDHIENEDVEIIGFFSTQHKGVFTHHDSFLHMHLITKDESKMGHVDELNMEEMILYLPQK